MVLITRSLIIIAIRRKVFEELTRTGESRSVVKVFKRREHASGQAMKSRMIERYVPFSHCGGELGCGQEVFRMNKGRNSTAVR